MSEPAVTHHQAIRLLGFLTALVVICGALVAAGSMRRLSLHWPNLFSAAAPGQYPAQETSIVAPAAQRPARGAASGPLSVHPTNPRYFADANGRVVYLTGSHTWANFQDSGGADPPERFDYTAYLDFLEAENHNFFRLWAWEQTEGGPWTGEDIYFAPSMYERTGPGLAKDGKPKFDVTKFNQAYFDRLRERVIEASERGMYVSVMLFDGWSVEDKDLAGRNPWLTHPYHRDNNINNVDGDPNRDDQGREVHTLEIAQITQLQEAYIRKVIDTIGDLDNVLFEISNESHANSQGWQYHFITFIKDYERTKARQHPVGMTVEWPGGDNADLFNGPADWVSPNNYADAPPADGSKVIVTDTDHIWGIGGDREWVWKSFLRGLNLLFMDPYNCSSVWPPDSCDPADPTWVSLRHNLGYARAYAERIDLAKMIPRGDLCSTSYCLANAANTGAEYLVYLPVGRTAASLLQSLGINRNPAVYIASDSAVTVDLSASEGTLHVEWFNPQTGETTVGESVAGGAVRSFVAPFQGDAVLYIYQENAPPNLPYRRYIPIVGIRGPTRSSCTM